MRAFLSSWGVTTVFFRGCATQEGDPQPIHGSRRDRNRADKQASSQAQAGKGFGGSVVSCPEPRGAPRRFEYRSPPVERQSTMERVENRRHLTPEAGVPAHGGSHGMRRGGARHEVSERVQLVGPNFKTRDGWAINVSRGGVRAILEESVE